LVEQERLSKTSSPRTFDPSLQGAQRRGNPAASESALDCFASLAMTEDAMKGDEALGDGGLPWISPECPSMGRS
jgi:hypothetical protein